MNSDLADTPFPPIADYAFLSNCEVNALVAADGSVEWLCLPRPDSPSVFGSLLDRSAGVFRFSPSNTRVPAQRRYVPGHDRAGDDVAHADGLGDDDRPPRRRADARRSAASRTTAAPRATTRPGRSCSGSRRARADGSRWRSTACRCSTTASTGAQWSYDGEGYGRCVAEASSGRRPRRSQPRLQHGARVHARPLRRPHDALRRATRCSSRCRGATTRRRRLDDAFEQLHQTESFWRDWLSKGRFPDHRFRPYIERSALALKGLSYAPTGAIMAAATTSLPETPGGERNWDYRYTWIRDSAFMLRALHELGFDWEALEYFAFVIDAVTTGDDGDVRPPDHVRHRRRARPDRAHARPPVRLPRLAAGAGRQRRVRPEAARRVGDDPRLDRHAPAQRGPDGAEGVGRARRARRHRNRAGRRSPTRASGRCAGRRSTSSRRRSCAGSRPTAARTSRADREDHERADRWQQAADEIKADVCAKGVDDARRLHPALRQHRARRRQPADPDHGLPPRRRPARRARRCSRSPTSSPTTGWSCATASTRPTTGCRTPPKEASRSARSGWCRRSR